MKKLILALPLLVLSFTISAQKTVTTWHDEAKTIVKEIYTVKKTSTGQEVKDGLYRIYYPDKVLWQEGHFVNNKLSGLWKDYYEDGTLKQEMPYTNDLLNGTLKYYSPSGALQQEVSYVNDVVDGKVITYHENGQIHEESMYRNGPIGCNT